MPQAIARAVKMLRRLRMTFAVPEAGRALVAAAVRRLVNLGLVEVAVGVSHAGVEGFLLQALRVASSRSFTGRPPAPLGCFDWVGAPLFSLDCWLDFCCWP